MSTPSSRPLAGYALEVTRGERSTTLWWGADAAEDDVVATNEGRVLTWATPEGCLATAAAEGWEIATSEPTRLDLTAALEWRRRARRVLDAEAALGAWNLAGDVARSTGAHWDDRGRIADACHRKLTLACLPWLVGQEAHAPRWTVAEDRYLRQRLDAAFTLFDRLLDGRRRPGS